MSWHELCLQRIYEFWEIRRALSNRIKKKKNKIEEKFYNEEMSKFRKNETAKRLTDKKQRGLVFFHLLTKHHTWQSATSLPFH